MNALLRCTFAATLAVVLLSACHSDPAASIVAPAHPLLGKGSGGGGTTNSCLTEITNLSLRSGGNKGGHTTIPNSMHVFYDFTYTPCVPWGRVNVVVRDHLTGTDAGSIFTWANGDSTYTTFSWTTPNGPMATSTWPWIGTMWSGTQPHLFSYYTSDAKFSYQYDVEVTAYDWFSGVVTSSVTKSIVTNPKL